MSLVGRRAGCFEWSILIKTGEATSVFGTLKKTIRRRRVARLFPNEATSLRLASAIPVEFSEDQQSASKRYLVFNNEAASEVLPKLQNECCSI